MRENLSLYRKTQELPSSVSVISIPLEYGSDVRGFSETPEYLFTQGLADAITSAGADLATLQTIECPTLQFPGIEAAKHLNSIAHIAHNASKAVQQSIERGEIVLTLGGDHAISAGTIAGAKEACDSLGVIWIDAHPDLHTPETSLTGNVHGMGAAIALGLGPDALVGHTRRHIKPEHFLYIGLKDMDGAEIERIEELGLDAISMLDIATLGLSPAIKAIDTLRSKVTHIWISMDIDSIDEQFAPGVGMPSKHGFTAREIDSLAHHIGKTCNIAGLDIVEVLPCADKDGVTAQLTLSLIARFLGGAYGGYHSYIESYETRRQNSLYTQ